MHIQKSFQGSHSSGTLYLVGTPIGNLEDMTFRAVRILQEADCIAAEDTRQTRKLLTHYEITPKQLVSYHEHNKHTSGPELIRMLQQGRSVALVSDAGLPAVSDPGSDVVRLAIAEQIPVVPIPGANAALSALIVSGLSTETFLFVGFLPRDKKKLQEHIDRIRSTHGTIILYEAPHRLRKTLASLYDAWGDRPAAVVREITKRYEEVFRGTLASCIEHFQENDPKGEICLLVEAPGTPADSTERWWDEMSIPTHVQIYEQRGLNRKDAMKQVAVDRGISRRDVYQACL